MTPTPTADTFPASLTPLMSIIVDQIPASLEQNCDLEAEEAALDAKIAALRKAILQYGGNDARTTKALPADASLGDPTASQTHGTNKRRGEDKENARPLSGSGLSPRKAHAMAKLGKAPPISPGSTSLKSKRMGQVWVEDDARSALARRLKQNTKEAGAVEV